MLRRWKGKLRRARQGSGEACHTAAIGYCFHFAVFVWFETIVWRTFGTIEREIGPSEAAG